MVNWTATIIFVALFLLVAVLGFIAANWRKGNLNDINQWGLGGRSFGTIVTWFLLGGDLYTAYTFIAIPGTVYALGAYGFFAVPYTIIVYPLVFLMMPRLWAVANKHGYVTAADFVRSRFDSRPLALAVALTGILATMPYIALQLVGLQVVIAMLGIQGTGIFADLPLFIAFVVLAAYTYTSGLRAPALISFVKDLLIYVTVIAIIIYVPTHLGGFANIFAHVPKAKLTLTDAQVPLYWTVALGSALALFLYPHSITGVLSSKSGKVVKRNAALLPAYSFMLAMLAMVGFMALASGVKLGSLVNGVKVASINYIVPAFIQQQFPDWFVGVAFAAIGIGALVPAAVMSIAASNLFTRNIYKDFFRPNCSQKEEANVAKLVSLIVKFGALLFVIGLPLQNALNFQLLGGVWILQIFPAVIFALYTRWFNRWALLVGWAIGMYAGTAMVLSTYVAKTGGISTAYAISIMGHKYLGFAGFYALLLNVGIAIVLSLVFNLVRLPNGKDATIAADYTDIGAGLTTGPGEVIEPGY